MATQPFTANYTNLELYLKNLAFKPNTAYTLTMDTLGGEMELYFQSQIIEHGVRHIPAAEVWTPFSLSFTTAEEVAHLSQWGICFVKTAWAGHAYGGTYCPTYVDNVQIKETVTGWELLTGGDFEQNADSAVYDAHWRSSILGERGRSLGVSIVVDPLRPDNHCLRFPEVIANLSYPEPLPLQVHSVGKFQSIAQNIRCIELYGRAEPRLLLVECGSITVEIDDAVIRIPEGSVFCLPANRPYRYTYHAIPDAHTIYYWLAMSGSQLPEVLSKLHLTDEHPLPLPRIDALSSLTEAMLQLSPQSETYHYAITGYLQVLCGELERQISPQPAKTTYHDYIHDIARRLRHHPEITPSNAVLANAASVKTTLSAYSRKRLVRRHTDIGFKR